MGNALAIDMKGVGKRYPLGQDHRMNRSLPEAFLRRFAKPSERRDEIWSLRDIDLEVAEGEALGIVGSNGAGKSTLLKILARITEPTVGVSRTRGRIGSLLEVGTGFHPELTGRENVYLSGAVSGMRRSRITSLYDEIVAFAGVERFLDTPVKRYSSGMYLRLAFAVAAHLDADILLVDEVLAVGDANFQRKCLGKMAEVEGSGRTVIFVSHNLDAVERLCGRALWLREGLIAASGSAGDVIGRYLGSDVRRSGEIVLAPQEGASATIERVVLRDPDGLSAEVHDRNDPITIEVSFTVHERTPNLTLSLYIQNLRNIRILDEALGDTGLSLAEPGQYTARLVVPPVLNVGDYTVGLWMGTGYEEVFWRNELLNFRLEGDSQGRSERVLQLNLRWEVMESGDERQVAIDTARDHADDLGS